VLHERDDFVDLLVTVGEATGAGAAIVEKDYWVTEALRLIAASFGAGVVFKGGTSLSKAWDLIQRFSEDIDLLVRSEGDGLERGCPHRRGTSTAVFGLTVRR
jgi:predicted nucleotidyltransferase component of viral defense system